MAADNRPIRLGIVSVGKIVRDQHLPAIASNSDFQLVAAASRNATIDGTANFKSIEDLLAVVQELDALSLCMPPQARYEAAHAAISAGKHVFLEKPPGATISEVEDLRALAEAKGVTLFASWHSRYAPAVEAARAFLGSTQSSPPRSSGKRTCGAGIRTRTGFGRLAASASSTRSSTRCPSSRYIAAAAHHLGGAGFP